MDNCGFRIPAASVCIFLKKIVFITSLSKQPPSALWLPIPEGFLWAAGTNQSLYLIDARQRKMIAEYPGPNFLKTHVYALCNDLQSDDLWLGTMETGLVRFDKRKRQFIESFTTEDGLAGNVIAALLMDRKPALG